jgi:hypothetical protein
MTGGWRTFLAILLAGCTASGPLSAKQALPAVPYSPTAAYEWPLWPTADGRLIGGSGYTTGYDGPWGISPGLGIGAVLLPSLTAAHTLMPGILPWPPPPVAGPFPLWVSASDVEAHASDVPTVPVPALVNAPAHPSDTSGQPGPLYLGPSPYPVRPTWTKMGPTLVPPQSYTAWPQAAFHLSPWGPVIWQPGPLPSNTPLVPLGFPPADGTPISQGTFLPWVRVIRGTQELVLWDVVTRTLHRVPSLIPLAAATFAGATQRDGLLLTASPTASGVLKLVDLLTGGLDLFPEITNAVPELDGNLSWKGWFIVYTALHEGRRQVHLFDRRTRTIDRLSRLNGAAECFGAATDQMARLIVYVTIRDGQQDLGLYDTATGLVDPLPAVNSENDEFAPFLSDDGRWLLFIRKVAGIGRILLYDRATSAIDPLVELNTLGDYSTTGITGDGLIINATVTRNGRRRGVVYVRPSGFIDPIPEVNDTADDVYF